MVQWFGLCTFTADCLGSIPAWLRLCTFTAEGLGLIPDGGAATPQAAMWGQKKKRKKLYMRSLISSLILQVVTTFLDILVCTS